MLHKLLQLSGRAWDCSLCNYPKVRCSTQRSSFPFTLCPTITKKRFDIFLFWHGQSLFYCLRGQFTIKSTPFCIWRLQFICYALTPYVPCFKLNAYYLMLSNAWILAKHCFLCSFSKKNLTHPYKTLFKSPKSYPIMFFLLLSTRLDNLNSCMNKLK